MSDHVVTSSSIAHFLERCGYAPGAQLIRHYHFDDTVVPFAGFHGEPFDTRSACIAIVDAGADQDSAAAAAACMGLGAPTAFVCKGAELDCWRLSPEGPSERRGIAPSGVAGFFEQYKTELTPASIYSAKLRRLPADARRRQRQMQFVDLGLMPATERRAGQSLHRFVETVILQLADRLHGRLKRKKDFADLYRTVFWLLAAKLLHEKGVENFRKIDLTDLDLVFARVGRHYSNSEGLPPGGKLWRPAIQEAAKTVARWGYIGNISPESLAYLYETALIDNPPKGLSRAQLADRGIRKELGIHSTPSILIDHILSQAWPLVERYHSPEDRHVFEPACGVAGFLVAAMRWLRDFTELPPGETRQGFLRRRLHGVEIEPFAAELARLSLTLADVPFGNSWDIDNRDMFQPQVLEKPASRAALLLANPPFEAFNPAQRREYARAGAAVTAQTKAVEMVKRAIPRLKPNGIFGLVLPQGVLHDDESKSFRKFLMRECDISEISLFADTLFEEGEHEVAVLIGRRRDSASFGSQRVTYRRVRESGMEGFKERLAFTSEQTVPQSRFNLLHDLFLPELVELWDYLKHNRNPELGSIAKVGQGLAHVGKKKLPPGAWTIHDPPHPGDPLGYAKPGRMTIYRLPTPVGMNLDRSVLLHVRTGLPSNKPQILVNYGRGSRDPWRLRAAIDRRGRAISSRLVNVRPYPGTIGHVPLWAILNSPIANAYAHSHTMKRDILVGLIRKIPMPAVGFESERYEAVSHAAMAYLKIVKAKDRSEDDIRKALMRVDAEVLKLYDLPPRLERQLLLLFTGVQRKRVGCTFTGYYSPHFESFVPLHRLISDEYRRAALGEILKRHTPATQTDQLAALRRAMSDFGEE